MSLHLRTCHIVGNHMSRLIIIIIFLINALRDADKHCSLIMFYLIKPAYSSPSRYHIKICTKFKCVNTDREYKLSSLNQG